ncbi:hypothetical protein [Cytobacillus horneckiae]|uniref:hypothetical protein n=1 Tax=Cytobacillus horneckiae TaxID=549687 RepID=UPI003D9A8E3A
MTYDEFKKKFVKDMAAAAQSVPISEADVAKAFVTVDITMKIIAGEVKKAERTAKRELRRTNDNAKTNNNRL